MAPYLYQFSAVVQKLQFLGATLLGTIWCYFSITIKKTHAGTAPSKCAIRGQHQHQSIKKTPYSIPIKHFFGANKVQI